MLGKMMDRQLTLDLILERGGRYFPEKEIVWRAESGVHRYAYADFFRRTKQLANALKKLGVEAGERVATFCWNHAQHLELYFAIPITGAVLHTVNLRLFAEQIVYIFNHAEDRILFLDRSLFPLLAPLLGQLPRLKTIVLTGEGETPPAPAGKALLDYEALIQDQPAVYDYPALEERTALGLCYTSGTTGEPKGVLYSHRSTVIHSLAACLPAVVNLAETDSVLPAVPMFHANAWGLPYSCVLVGAKLVFPGRQLDPASLIELMASEEVTFSAGVPTIWAGILQLLDQKPGQLPRLKRMGLGGSAPPRSLFEGFRERHGIEVFQGWGMTETSPAGTHGHVKSSLPQSGPAHYDIRTSQGIPAPLVEVKGLDEQGKEIPWDGKTMGHLVVRGPWIASGYFNNPSASEALLTPDGWMRTGDMITINAHGYIKITDRAKDLIKSGGEWISSVDMENTLMGHPKVAEAAVIAVPDPKWQERPLAVIVPKKDHSVTAAELRDYLLARMAKWQVPDRFEFMTEIPKTSVGKFDKKVLRAKLT